MNFTIRYNFDIETKQYIAEIPEYNLSDFWDTIDEADKNVKVALSLYLEEMLSDKRSKEQKLKYA